jgi:hypothetical protein
VAQGRLQANGVETLRKTVRERGAVDAAQIRLIGLEGMNPPAGADPSSFEASVRLQSLRFLQRHFRAEDVVLSCGDGFLIIYDTSNVRDPTKDGEQIQNALNALYQRETGMQALRVEVSAYRLERRQAIAMDALPAMRRAGDIAYTTSLHRVGAGPTKSSRRFALRPPITPPANYTAAMIRTIARTGAIRTATSLRSTWRYSTARSPP